MPILLFVLIQNYSLLIYPQVAEESSQLKETIGQSTSLSQIGKIEVIEHGPRTKHLIALTFDADMTKGMLILLQKKVIKSWYNQNVVDYLKKNQIPATLFLTGLWVKTYPAQAASLAKNPLF